MALGLTPEHLELAAAVRGWAERHCPAEALRAAVDSRRRRRGALPRHAAARAGRAGPARPAPAGGAGGQGYGLPELAVARRGTRPGAAPRRLPADRARQRGPGRRRRGRRRLDAAGQATWPARHADRGGRVRAGIRGLTGRAGRRRRPDDRRRRAGPVLGGSAGRRADRCRPPCTARTATAAGWCSTRPTWTITAAGQPRPHPPLATVRADGVTRARRPGARPGSTARRGASLAAILFGAEACGIADWAVHTAAEYAKIRHQFGRPIGQFQAVKHRCAWMLTARSRPRPRSGTPPRTAGRAPRRRRRVRRRGGRAWSRSTPRSLRERLHPGPRRHRLHLGARRAPVLPAGAVAARPARPARRSGAAAGRRAGHGRRDRGRSGSSCPTATPSSARAGPGRAGRDRAAHRHRADRQARWPRAAGCCRTCRGRGGGTPSRWSSSSSTRRCGRPGVRAHELAIGAWVVPALIQYGTPEQQERFLPATLRGELPVVPAVQRAGRRLRPGRADHPGRAGRGRLAAHRPEDLDLAGQAGRLGASASPAPTRRRPGTTGSPTSWST